MSRPRDDDSRPLRFGYYLVAFIDILGQSQELRRLRRMPQTEDEKREVLLTLGSTVGVVRNFRDSFEQFFSAVAPDPQRLAAIPEAQRENYRRLFSVRPSYRGFSDAVVITVSLAGSDDIEVVAALSAVQRALLAIAGASLNLLANGGISLRGGIDVGLGVEAFDGEYYGSALLDAYQLESKSADYPRVVVGKGLLNYLGAMERGPFTLPNLETLAKGIVRQSRRMFVGDPEDNLYAIDPLSVIGDKGSPHYEELIALVPKAFGAVEEQRHRWSEDRNLLRRYERLARLFVTSPNADLLGTPDVIEQWKALTAGPNKELRFGTPAEWDAFGDRHPRFLERFPTIESAVNSAFARDTGALSRPDVLTFFLGQQCVDDFFEIMTLCGNAEGYGAQKLLRTMFERVVLVKYLAEHPEKVDVYFNYFHVTKHEQVEAIERFKGADVLPADKVAEARRRYEDVKEQYRTRKCAQCDHREMSASWTEVGVPDMAEEVGLGEFVISAYYEPLLQSQPTLQGLLRRMESDKEGGAMGLGKRLDQDLADSVLACSHALVLVVLELQVKQFRLPDQPYKSLADDWIYVWKREPGMRERADPNAPPTQSPNEGE